VRSNGESPHGLVARANARARRSRRRGLPQRRRPARCCVPRARASRRKATGSRPPPAPPRSPPPLERAHGGHGSTVRSRAGGGRPRQTARPCAENAPCGAVNPAHGPARRLVRNAIRGRADRAGCGEAAFIASLVAGTRRSQWQRLVRRGGLALATMAAFAARFRNYGVMAICEPDRPSRVYL
jgi:hypothetical protein